MAGFACRLLGWGLVTPPAPVPSRGEAGGELLLAELVPPERHRNKARERTQERVRIMWPLSSSRRPGWRRREFRTARGPGERDCEGCAGASRGPARFLSRRPQVQVVRHSAERRAVEGG